MVKIVSARPSIGESEPVEDATSFDDLAAQADAIDAGGAAPGQPGSSIATAPADPAVTMTAEFFSLLKLPRSLAAPRFTWWPEFGNVWSDDQLQQIAGALAAVCIDQGWSLEDLMGKYGPWIALALAAGMPSFVTWSAIQDKRAELALQAEASRRQASSSQHRGDAQ